MFGDLLMRESKRFLPSNNCIHQLHTFCQACLAQISQLVCESLRHILRQSLVAVKHIEIEGLFYQINEVTWMSADVRVKVIYHDLQRCWDPNWMLLLSLFPLLELIAAL